MRRRTPNPQDLLFGRSGDRFEIAVESDIPAELDCDFVRIRYEIAIRIDSQSLEGLIASETLRFKGLDDPAGFL